MKYSLFPVVFALMLCSSAAFSAGFETDMFPTSRGELRITFIGHGSLMLEFGGTVIHVDPWSSLADYSRLPKADAVLITHHHIDHLDSMALRLCCTEKTLVAGTERCAKMYPGIRPVRYGDTLSVAGIPVEVVPAYNPKPSTLPSPVHPWGVCNGYVLTCGDTRVYFAGETENIPEMKDVKDIDILFLAADNVYNMTAEMAVSAVKVIRPKVYYPIHFSDLDPSRIAEQLQGSGIEVRLRKMK
jgi:L-ascorbate metabolism protein UlaG (beta-lactamase superfamily)